jgi:hypothetical protein
VVCDTNQFVSIPDVQPPIRPADAANISRWTRSYARHRSLALLFALCIYAAIMLSLSLASKWAGDWWRAGQYLEAGLAGVVLVLLAGTIVWLSVPKWGGLWLKNIGNRAYSTEGRVDVNYTYAPNVKRVHRVVLALFLMGVLMMATLGDRVPTRFRMPVTAVFVIPFLLFVIRSARAAAGPVYYLWPVLYIVHALLLVAGAPIFFTGKYEPLNFLIPNIGYGILTAGIAHVYSRFALNRLREAARWPS